MVPCSDHVQFGVAVPNGAEALIHFRKILEAEVVDSGSAAVAVLDVHGQLSSPLNCGSATHEPPLSTD